MIALSRHLVGSTLLCFLLGGLACCFRRQRAATRHAAWLIGISKFAIPSALFAATGAQLAFFLPASSWFSSLVLKLSALLAAVFPIFPVSFTRVDMPAMRIALIAIWALGTAVLFLNWRKRLRVAYAFLEIPWDDQQQALNRASKRLGLSTPVPLRLSDNALEPSLIGFLHPTITIPKDLSNGLTRTELETVLLHELAHAIRRDNLAAAFVHFLVCIFWFHPLLWLVERRLVTERERACDQMVIASGVAPQVYIAGILKVCKFHLLEPVAGVSGIASSDLRRRLDLILSVRPDRPLPYSPRLLLAALALVMALLPIANGYCEQCVSNGRSAVLHTATDNLKK